MYDEVGNVGLVVSTGSKRGLRWRHGPDTQLGYLYTASSLLYAKIANGLDIRKQL